MSALTRLLRFLRVRDWIVHWPVLLALAAVYAGHAAPGFWSRLPWLLAMQTLLITAGYLMNDAFDAEADREKRGGSPPARGHRRVRIAATAVALLGGLSMAMVLAPAQRVFVGAVVVLGLGYSLPGVHLKERGVLGLAAAALLQRVPAFALMVEWPPHAPWLAGGLVLWLFVLGLVFILEHQLEDFDSDRRTGVRTWATRAGRAAAARARDAAGVALWAVAVLVTAVRWRAWSDALPALLVPAATALTLAMVRRRYAPNRRLPVRPAFSRAEPVVIHGAGLAGLVAAIKLADWGVAVEVREQRLSIGGKAESLPFVHSMQQDPAAIAAHLGLPIESAFERTRREIAWLGGRRIEVRPRHWNCVRGGVEGALDRMLLEWAQARGVVVHFGRPLRADDVPNGVEILASGHSPLAFGKLGHLCEPLEGWCAEAPWGGEPLLLSFRDRWTGSGYAYAASAGGRVYALVFSRGPLPPEALPEFERALATNAGLRFEHWVRRSGVAPAEVAFERGGYLLAGAAAGFLDPFYLSGVGPSLVSGGLAAFAVIDRDEARRRFNRFTRSFSWRQRAGQHAWRSSPGSAGFWLAMAAALAVRPVGHLHRDGTGP